jgi:hypothetical protein
MRLRRAGLAASAAIGAFALGPQAAQAANFEVNTLTDAAADPCTTDPNGCTLRDAVTDASANAEPDLITFQSGLTGTVTLTQGQLQTNGSTADTVTIQGPGANVITVSGDADSSGTPNAGDSRIFSVPYVMTGASQLTLSGLTLSGGFAGASAPGGAIYLGEGARLALDDMTVTDNAAGTGSGGAIGSDFGKYSRITITDSTISGNDAGTGAGISSAGPLSIDNSTLSGNDATGGSGGAIAFTQKYGPLEISDSTISGNSSPTGGGVSVSPFSGPKYVAPDSQITNTTISGNDAAFSGGGVLLFSLLDDQGSLTITHSTISGNNTTNTTSYGGGIDIGGGIVNGSVRVVDSTVSGNESGVGGGVSARSELGPNGSVSASNSTIASNTVTYEGGGLWVESFGPSGGPYTSPPIPLNNTLVGDNTAGGSPDDLGRDNMSTGGGFQLSFSLVEAPADAIDTQANSILGVDPQLGGLANNGGPTQTHKPAVSSPAIDKGAAFGQASDQRGDGRPFEIPTIPNAPGGDGSDIGAVELQADELPSNTFSARVKGKKLIVTVLSAGQVAVADTRARLSAVAAKKKKGKRKKRKLFLKPSSSSGGPPTITVPLRLTKLANSKLRRKGKVSTRARVTFTPNFGIPNTQNLKLRIGGKKKKRR